MDFELELVMIPVSDVDRAKAFYTQRLGFSQDVDFQPNEGFRVVQMTPPGSACSIAIGTGITDASPGSSRGTHLVVSDIVAARAGPPGVRLLAGETGRECVWAGSRRFDDA